MDEEQFEAVRNWGEGLRGDSREEVRAAGQAIVLLCAEVDRLERELWNEKALVSEPRPEDASGEDGEPSLMEATLRTRLRHFAGALYTRPAKR